MLGLEIWILHGVSKDTDTDKEYKIHSGLSLFWVDV